MDKSYESDRAWLASLFEFEACEECGRGAEAHAVTYALGNPFAYCVPPEVRPLFRDPITGRTVYNDPPR